MKDSDTTHFGYKSVPIEEKAQLVRSVFDSVANRYDIMNDLMSMGVHRLWKHAAVALSRVRPADHVLDLAGGTGDLSALFHEQVKARGRVVLTDINAAMLQRGRDRLIDEGRARNVYYAQVDAERIPFRDNSFDVVSIGFGLRNVTDKDAALASIYRVLRPGGRLIVLEFSKPYGAAFRKLYDLYSMHLLPLMGQVVTHDADSYRYLAESIRMHPDQETLLGMMRHAGLERCEYFNFTNGVVAVHRGYKF